MVSAEYGILVKDQFTQEEIEPLLKEAPDHWHQAVRRLPVGKKKSGLFVTEMDLSPDYWEYWRYGPFFLSSVETEGNFWGMRPGVYLVTEAIIDDEPTVLENQLAHVVLGAQAFREMDVSDVGVISLVGWLGEEGVEGKRLASVLSLQTCEPELIDKGFFKLADRGYFLVHQNSCRR